MKTCRRCLFLILALLPLAAAAATPLSPAVAAVREQWAQVAYQTPKPQRVQAYSALATHAAAARQAAPQDPAALIWEGIVLSSEAGERGGLGALSLVKRARADFEQALRLDPAALNGSACTSLGALYYQVPGWPVGFGDDAKARALLLQGLQYDPNGIDANYFYGDFLRDQKDWNGAAAALKKALAAPPRPGRELADRGRRQQIQAALQEVEPHLASH
jgi:tetratricopeptide (TPR) repeat protein